jgi:hypothetical protein
MRRECTLTYSLINSSISLAVCQAILASPAIAILLVQNCLASVAAPAGSASFADSGFFCSTQPPGTDAQANPIATRILAGWNKNERRVMAAVSPMASPEKAGERSGNDMLELFEFEPFVSDQKISFDPKLMRP